MQPPRDVPPDLAWIPGGTFRMGTDDFYPEEGPAHEATVEGFLIERHPVTVRQFRRFVEETGYVTLAEREPDPALYPGADPELLRPGSAVFRKPSRPVPTTDLMTWWSYVPGACWRHPAGPGSDVRGRERHPVTHVAYEDAVAYATWAGRELPTEAEWERAARGGLGGSVFAWGDDERPGGQLMANTWQGRFPWENLKANGYEGTSPVGAFPPNAYGLYDVTGNVWEWTADRWTASHAERVGGCCGGAPARAAGPIGERVMKGGSHLCAPSYCLRYRPAARHPQAEDSSTSHLGFRCVVRLSS